MVFVGVRAKDLKPKIEGVLNVSFLFWCSFVSTFNINVCVCVSPNLTWWRTSFSPLACRFLSDPIMGSRILFLFYRQLTPPNARDRSCGFRCRTIAHWFFFFFCDEQKKSHLGGKELKVFAVTPSKKIVDFVVFTRSDVKLQISSEIYRRSFRCGQRSDHMRWAHRKKKH